MKLQNRRIFMNRNSNNKMDATCDFEPFAFLLLNGVVVGEGYNFEERADEKVSTALQWSLNILPLAFACRSLHIEKFMSISIIELQLQWREKRVVHRGRAKLKFCLSVRKKWCMRKLSTSELWSDDTRDVFFFDSHFSWLLLGCAGCVLASGATRSFKVLYRSDGDQEIRGRGR